MISNQSTLRKQNTKNLNINKYNQPNTLLQYKKIKGYCDKFPNQSQSLFQTYHDLTLSQKWFKVDVNEIENLKWVIIKGQKSIDVSLHTINNA